MDMAAKADVVQNGHAAENFNFLKSPRHTQFGPFIWFQVIDFTALEENRSFLRVVKTVDTIHHHGLAGPIGSDDGVYLSFADLQADSR